MLNSDRVAGVVFMTGSDWAGLFAIIVLTVHILTVHLLDYLPSLYLLYTLGSELIFSATGGRVKFLSAV